MNKKVRPKIKFHKQTRWNIPLIVATASIFCAIIISVTMFFVWMFNDNSIAMSIDDITSVNLEFGEVYELPEVTAKGYGRLFNKKGVPLDVEKNGEINFNSLGEYTVTYKTSYKKLKKEAEIVVSIKDSEAPEITLISNPDGFTKPGSTYIEEGYTAYDNYDGDITDKVVRTETDGKVTYTVSDSSGNEAVVTRNIVYKDVVPPEIVLKGNSVVKLETGSNYTEHGYCATDDCDGDITGEVVVEGSVNTSTPGTYYLKYKVSDKYGNQATATRTVTVYKKQNNSSGAGNKVVYLTFDDGPSEYTQRLLDILDKYNVKATFFVTNQFPGYVNMIGEEYRRGHTVAMHTYSHKYSIYSSEESYFEDLDKISALCEAQTGVKPTILRFPGGSSNTISKKYCSGIMAQLAQSVQARNLVYCDWNVASGDAGGTSSRQQVYQNVTDGISGKKVSIVLQHDIHGFSVEAVDDIIAWGLANGYTFLPLKPDSPVVHHNINN